MRQSTKDPRTLDPLRRKIFALLQQREVSAATASRAMGRDESYLFGYLWKGTPRTLPEAHRYELARLLRVDESELRDPDLAPPPSAGLAVPPITGHRMPDLPVYRDTGLEPHFLDLPEDELIVRPDWLTGVRRAFGVRVGHGSLPWAAAGDVVFCHPTQAARAGDRVVVHYLDGRAAVHLLASIDADGRMMLAGRTAGDPEPLPDDAAHRVYRATGAWWA